MASARFSGGPLCLIFQQLLQEEVLSHCLLVNSLGQLSREVFPYGRIKKPGFRGKVVTASG